MPRPIEAVVHPDALAHNLRHVRTHAPSARAWAVVKANAYGHGIERAVPAFMPHADGIALLDLAEAERVRALGWRGPVLLLEGCFEPRDLEACSRLALSHVVHQPAQIDWLAAHKTQRPHTVYLKFNSGMNRLGLPAASWRAAWQRLAALPQVDEVVAMTHFAEADGARGIDEALAAFEAVAADAAGERSIANSATLLRHGVPVRAAGGWVRPGIALYGNAPDHPLHDAAAWGLRPGMTLRSRVIAMQRLAPGARLGYGGAFEAEAPLTAAIVACGYADGYPRHAPTGTPVLVAGCRTRTLGRVSMDMLAVEWPDAAGAPRLDAEVTLWGHALDADGPRATLDIGDVAHAAGTLGYELMCGVAPRVPMRSADAG